MMRISKADFDALPKIAKVLERAVPLSMIDCRDNPKQRAHQKYRNERIETAEGLKFDSRAEYRHWCYLLIRQKAKEISNLQRQVSFELVPAQMAPDGSKVRPVAYVADFTYIEKDGTFVCEDPKGFSTPEWRIKRKMMLHVHKIWVREVRT